MSYYYQAESSSSAVSYFICTFFFMWIFKKAKKPMWAPFVPFYNFYVLLEITGLNPFLIFLIFVPIVNIVVAFILLFLVPIRLSKSFGHSTLFGLGLIFFPIIFSAIIAFSSSTYIGPNGKRVEDLSSDDEDSSLAEEEKETFIASDKKKKTCPYCGVQIKDGSKKCFLCGRRIS